MRDAHVVVTSVVAYAEARATFARRRRERLMTTSEMRAAVRQLDADWLRFVAVTVDDELGARRVDWQTRTDFAAATLCIWHRSNRSWPALKTTMSGSRVRMTGWHARRGTWDSDRIFCDNTKRMFTLGKTLTIKGELRATEDLTIEGRVIGPIHCERSAVVVADSADVTGNIIARDITVFGRTSDSSPRRTSWTSARRRQ